MPHAQLLPSQPAHFLFSMLSSHTTLVQLALSLSQSVTPQIPDLSALTFLSTFQLFIHYTV